METKIVGQWTEKVYGNVYRDSAVKMRLYILKNAFNEIPNGYWRLLLNDEISYPEVLMQVSGKRSKTTRGMLGAIESMEITVVKLKEIINSPLKGTHLEAIAIMYNYDYEKLKELIFSLDNSNV